MKSFMIYTLQKVVSIMMFCLLSIPSVIAQFTAKDLGYTLNKGHVQDNFSAWQTLPLNPNSEIFSGKLSYRIKTCTSVVNRNTGQMAHPLGMVEVKSVSDASYKGNMISGNMIITGTSLSASDKYGSGPARENDEVMKIYVVIDLKNQNYFESEITSFYKIKSIVFEPDIIDSDEVSTPTSGRNKIQSAIDKYLTPSYKLHTLQEDEWTEWNTIQDVDWNDGFKYQINYRIKKCSNPGVAAYDNESHQPKHTCNILEIASSGVLPFDPDYGILTGTLEFSNGSDFNQKIYFVLSKGKISSYRIDNYDAQVKRLFVQIPVSEYFEIKKRENGPQTSVSIHGKDLGNRIMMNYKSIYDFGKLHPETLSPIPQIPYYSTKNGIKVFKRAATFGVRG